jgi:transposase-like protein
LSEKNLLDEVVPKIKRSISPEEKEKIIQAHKTYKGIIKRAANDLGFAEPTITKYWVEANLHEKRKRNSFQGDPLSYFNENKELFKGMTRSQLHKNHPGLYFKLSRNNQLD